MGRLSIVSYRIHDLSHDPSILKEYQDPSNYLRGCDGDWIEMLRCNPCSEKDDIALILAVADNRVIGRLGLYAGSAIYNDRTERTFWMEGFFLDEAYKKSGAGGLILLKAISFSKSLLAGSGDPPQSTRDLYKATGFLELGRLQRFIYFNGGKVIAQRYLGQGLFSSLLAATVSPLLRLYYRLRIGRAQPRLEYRPVEIFDARLDELIAGQTVSHFPRGSKVLNWILGCKKDVRAFEIFREGKLTGYCLVRTTRIALGRGEKVDGGLLDYYLRDESRQTKEDLILFCIRLFERERVDVIEIPTCDEDMAQTCPRFGLVHSGGNSVFFRPATTTARKPENRWFLTHAVGDQILLSR